jgi:hypothetical protein
MDTLVMTNDLPVVILNEVKDLRNSKTAVRDSSPRLGGTQNDIPRLVATGEGLREDKTSNRFGQILRTPSVSLWLASTS